MSYSKYEKLNFYNMPDTIPKILLSDALFLSQNSCCYKININQFYSFKAERPPEK